MGVVPRQYAEHRTGNALTKEGTCHRTGGANIIAADPKSGDGDLPSW